MCWSSSRSDLGGGSRKERGKSLRDRERERERERGRFAGGLQSRKYSLSNPRIVRLA